MSINCSKPTCWGSVLNFIQIDGEICNKQNTDILLSLTTVALNENHGNWRRYKTVESRKSTIMPSLNVLHKLSFFNFFQMRLNEYKVHQISKSPQHPFLHQNQFVKYCVVLKIKVIKISLKMKNSEISIIIPSLNQISSRTFKYMPT